LHLNDAASFWGSLVQASVNQYLAQLDERRTLDTR
jgi:hypothetical protein